MQINANHKNASLRIVLQTGMKLIFSKGDDVVEMDACSGDKFVHFDRMQIRRRYHDIIECVSESSRSHHQVRLAVLNAHEDIQCHFFNQGEPQPFTIPRGSEEEITLSFAPETGFSLSYEEKAMLPAADTVCTPTASTAPPSALPDMSQEEDPMAAFCQNESPFLTEEISHAEAEKAALRAQWNSQAEHLMRQKTELEKMRREIEEQQKEMALYQTQLEAVREVRNQPKEYVERLESELDIHNALVARYQSAPTGDESETELLDRLGVLWASFKETLSACIALRQAKADRESTPKDCAL